LTLAFLLIGVGLALGAACPPALIFAALGVAAFSAVSALVYGVRWLSRDYNVYKAKVAANDPDTAEGYFTYCMNRLGKWAGEHKGQAVVMGIGFALFVTALVITALAFTGGLAAVPILAGVIGGVGVSGTALGAVGAVFGGALGSSAIATTLASIFAGATLVLAPVNILDTIRRFASGVYEKNNSLAVVPTQVISIPPPAAPNLSQLHPPGFIPAPLIVQLVQQKEKLRPSMTKDEMAARKAKYSDVLQIKDAEPEKEGKHHPATKIKRPGGYESD